MFIAARYDFRGLTPSADWRRRGYGGLRLARRLCRIGCRCVQASAENVATIGPKRLVAWLLARSYPIDRVYPRPKRAWHRRLLIEWPAIARALNDLERARQAVAEETSNHEPQKKRCAEAANGVPCPLHQVHRDVPLGYRRTAQRRNGRPALASLLCAFRAVRRLSAVDDISLSRCCDCFVALPKS